MLARENFEGPHVRGKPGLSGYLVCLVHLISLMQPNKPDRPNRPNEQDGLADSFSNLLIKWSAQYSGQGGIGARYVLSFAVKSLRNLTTFGATTAVQYPWNGFRKKYS